MLILSSVPVNGDYIEPKATPRLSSASRFKDDVGVEHYVNYGDSGILLDGGVLVEPSLIDPPIDTGNEGGLPSGLTSLDCVFDSSGQPVLAFANNGLCILRWFDPLQEEVVLQNIGEGEEVKVSRDTQTPQTISQIVVTIKRGLRVFYRLSSERFTIEYEVPDDILAPISTLNGAYPTTNNRFTIKGRPLIDDFTRTRDSAMFGQSTITLP